MHHSTIERPGNGQPGALQLRPAQPRRDSVQSAESAPDAPLGITAKSSTPPDRELGMRAARQERYGALAQARSWMGRRVNVFKPEEQFPGNVYRTFDCRHVRTAHFVGVHYRPEFMQAHYRGIATCGSVWACPVCASVIQERRRLELEHLVQWANDQGLQAIMVTFTFPHTGFDTLSELLDRQADAFKRFRTGGPFRRLKDAMGFEGLVRSLEVTHGRHGWHPHTHELWLVKSSVDLAICSRITELWERACLAAGLLEHSDQVKLEAFRKHSVDVRLNASSGDYLAKQDSSRKWGITHEVAKATSKAGKAKGVHPHEFLVRKGPGDEARYFEYLEAMKGRRQLFWSPGLKGRSGLDDVDDQVIAEEASDPADLLGNLVQDEWEFIRSNRVVAQVLEAAEVGGWELVQRYLKRLGYRDRPQNEFPSRVTESP